MDEKIFLTAAEAREISETSSWLKNHVYREIKESARNNRRSIIWNLYGTSLETTNALIGDLRQNGYNAYLDDDDLATLHVEW